VTAWEPGVISLLVPSRDRAARCAAMWASAYAAVQDRDRVELVLYLDGDDPQLATYQWWTNGAPGRVTLHVGQRRLLTETWNELLPVAAGEYLWHGNDDVQFQTPGWDQHVRDAFELWPDRIGVVYGRDGIHNERLATLGFYHRAWVDTLGYLIAPHFASDYGDAWNDEVARAVGRTRFLPEVYTEHLHPAVGKGPEDQTFRERLTHQAESDQAWRDLAGERRREIERLRAAIEERRV
jgi:hypothetical protein